MKMRQIMNIKEYCNICIIMKESKACYDTIRKKEPVAMWNKDNKDNIIS